MCAVLGVVLWSRVVGPPRVVFCRPRTRVPRLCRARSPFVSHLGPICATPPTVTGKRYAIFAIASFMGKKKTRSVFPLVGRDFGKMMIGLSASLAIVLMIHYVIVPNGL